MYFIRKLLLNSIYGRFGMNLDTYSKHSQIISLDKLPNFMLNNVIVAGPGPAERVSNI